MWAGSCDTVRYCMVATPFVRWWQSIHADVINSSLGVYLRQKLISHSSGGWELLRSRSCLIWWYIRVSFVAYRLAFTWWKGAKIFLDLLCKVMLIPFLKASHDWDPLKGLISSNHHLVCQDYNPVSLEGHDGTLSALRTRSKSRKLIGVPGN